MKHWHRIELSNWATWHWLDIKQWCQERDIEFRSQHSTWTFWIQDAQAATMFRLRWS
jgi:hypothetical protein